MDRVSSTWNFTLRVLAGSISCSSHWNPLPRGDLMRKFGVLCLAILAPLVAGTSPALSAPGSLDTWLARTVGS